MEGIVRYRACREGSRRCAGATNLGAARPRLIAFRWRGERRAIRFWGPMDASPSLSSADLYARARAKVPVKLRLRAGVIARRRPGLAALLAVVTGGVYGLVWLYRVSRELRDTNSHEEIRPTRDVMLTVLTLGSTGSSSCTGKRAPSMRCRAISNARTTIDPPRRSCSRSVACSPSACSA